MASFSNSDSSLMDPFSNLTLSDIFLDGISKHRTCWLHIVAHHYHFNNYITWEEVKKIKKKYRDTNPCFYRSFPHRGVRGRLIQECSTSESSSGMDNNSVTANREGYKLDTDTFERYMESLWKNFSEDKKMPFAYLDSLWFSSYRESSTRPKVLMWIKQKGIFSKKYVFVPIVCWGHWSLLILVHFGESSGLGSNAPCMLLLDSLGNAGPKRLEPEIRKFVVDIYKAEGRPEDKNVLSRIPLLVPKVPQQRDDEECGIYVLYFIKLFMESAPENFIFSDISQEWFNPEDLDSFREELEKEAPIKKTKIRATRVTRHKRTRNGGVISIDD